MADYSAVTEVSYYQVTREQVQRIYTRYRFARDLCRDKDVLEVACGSGQGLGYLARGARSVVGVDIDGTLLGMAEKQYQGRTNIKLQKGDAHALPFPDNSFDVLILYEAIYYLEHPEKFMGEARRLLRDNGILLVCSANCELPDFNPSPYSHRYFSAAELHALYARTGFRDIEVLGDCAVDQTSWKASILSFMKKQAVAWRMIPKTMKGKEWLKRVLWGKLVPMPPEITDGLAAEIFPVKIDPSCPDRRHKVVFSLGHCSK